MSSHVTSQSPEETQELGKALGLLLRPGDVVLLSGELGAGKTQFTKGIALALGIQRPVTSPTFNLVMEYRDVQDVQDVQDARDRQDVQDVQDARDRQDVQSGQVLLRHFDLYRIEKEEELDDIDYFGLLEDKFISVVEWGDKFSESLPLDYLLIDFEFEGESRRKLHYSARGIHSKQLLSKIEEAHCGH